VPESFLPDFFPDPNNTTWTAFKRQDGTWGLKADWPRGSSANLIEARDKDHAELTARALNGLSKVNALEQELLLLTMDFWNEGSLLTPEFMEKCPLAREILQNAKRPKA
jgi:hypothetical protein